MIHYLSMDYLRLIIGFLCLGCSQEYNYIQYGGVISTHVIFLIIVIACPKYRPLRDNIL